MTLKVPFPVKVPLVKLRPDISSVPVVLTIRSFTREPALVAPVVLKIWKYPPSKVSVFAATAAPKTVRAALATFVVSTRPVRIVPPV